MGTWTVQMEKKLITKMESYLTLFGIYNVIRVSLPDMNF